MNIQEIQNSVKIDDLITVSLEGSKAPVTCAVRKVQKRGPFPQAVFIRHFGCLVQVAVGVDGKWIQS